MSEYIVVCESLKRAHLMFCHFVHAVAPRDNFRADYRCLKVRDICRDTMRFVSIQDRETRRLLQGFRGTELGEQEVESIIVDCFCNDRPIRRLAAISILIEEKRSEKT